MHRRAFLRAGGLAAGALVLGRARVRAQAPLRIGLVLPPGAAGEGVRRGVQMGVEEANRTAQLFGKSVELVEANAGETPAAAAERLVAQQGVFALVGGVDEAAALELGRVADAHKVLFFNVGAPADALRGRECRRYTFHVAASAAMLSDTVAQGLAGPGFPRRWFFVHPPTAEGHQLYGRGRAALANAGGAREAGNGDIGPNVHDFARVLADVRRSGADGMWVALPAAQRLELMAAYRALAPAPAFQLAGPFLDEVACRPLPADQRAGSWPTMWYHERKPFGAGSLSGRFLDRFNAPMDAAGWAGWVAPKILLEATERARSTDPTAVVAFLETPRAEFDGHKGVPLSFRPWDHQLRQPLYLLRPAPKPANDVDIFDVVAELPRRGPGVSDSSTVLLDRLGDGPTGGECHLADAPSAPTQ